MLVRQAAVSQRLILHTATLFQNPNMDSSGSRRKARMNTKVLL